MFDCKWTFILAALAAVLVSSLAAADSTATYVGAGACRNCHGETAQFTGKMHPKTDLDCDLCHKARNNALVKSYAKSAHASAIIDAEESPSLLKAKFAATSPVKKDQIVYALGAGSVKQSYLSANLMVLPAYWSVTANKWVKSAPVTPAPAKATPSKKKPVKGKPVKAAPPKVTLVNAATQCVGCHTTDYNPTKKEWGYMGVGCESCHGPGSDHVQAGDKTRITNPKSLAKDRQAMVCGQCHSKGTDTTKKYAFPVNFRPGDDLTKFFIDSKPKTPGMNQQYSEFVVSKHGKAGLLCTSCHDPHGPVQGTKHQLLKPTNELCTGCHTGQVLAKHAPDSPAGTTCATCHSPHSQQFK